MCHNEKLSAPYRIFTRECVRASLARNQWIIIIGFYRCYKMRICRLEVGASRVLQFSFGRSPGNFKGVRRWQYVLIWKFQYLLAYFPWRKIAFVRYLNWLIPVILHQQSERFQGGNETVYDFTFTLPITVWLYYLFSLHSRQKQHQKLKESERFFLFFFSSILDSSALRTGITFVLTASALDLTLNVKFLCEISSFFSL